MSFYLQSENSVEEESGISWVVHLESAETANGEVDGTNFRRFDNGDGQTDFTPPNACEVGSQGGANGPLGGGEVTPSQERSSELRGRVLATFVFNGIFVILVIGLFVSIALRLSRNWGNDCDVNLRIWCIVWISRFLTAVITRSAIMLVTRGYERPSPLPMVLIINIIHIFGIAWWFYGIHLIYTDPPNETCRQNLPIALFLFWFQFIQIFIPIVLPILICVFVLYLLHRNGTQTEKRSVPEKILCKIQAIPFQQHIQNMRSDNINVNIFSESRVGLPASVSPTGSEKTACNQGEALNKQASITISNFCPICVQEIDESVIIRILPCDNRHIFHKECIDDWFKQNCVCPICRSDIIQIIKDSQKESQHASLME